MLVTTTSSIEDKQIVRYCGIVAGEAILGANLFKDLFAGIRDLVGGRSATYERDFNARAILHLLNCSNALRTLVPMRWSGWISITR